MSRYLSTLLPLALLACAISDASAQGYRRYNGMEMTPYGPVQNPVGSADYQAFVRNPMGFDAYEAQKEQQAMVKYQQQYAKQYQQYMKQMQTQQKAYAKWKKEHPAEAAAQEKAYLAELAKENAPPGTGVGVKKARKKTVKPFSMSTAGKSAKEKKAEPADAGAGAGAKADPATPADANAKADGAKTDAKP